MLAPLENDPIISGISIQKFRHLQLQNLYTKADFRNRWEKSEEEQQEQEEEDPIIIEEDLKVTSLYMVEFGGIVLRMHN